MNMLNDFTEDTVKQFCKDYGHRSIRWEEDISHGSGLPRCDHCKSRWDQRGISFTELYLMQDKNLATKIGISKQPCTRLGQVNEVLRKSSNRLNEARLVFVARFFNILDQDAAVVELAMHELFAPQRLNGEWFNVPRWQSIATRMPVAIQRAREYNKNVYENMLNADDESSS